MQTTDGKPEAQFSQPIQQIFTMVVIFVLAAGGAYVAFPSLGPVFFSSIYLNGFIAMVFFVGVVACFWQVLALISSVNWIEGFAINRPGHEFVTPPRLLSSLANLLRSRSARMQIGSASARSILDSMATRLDEGREITRYIINLLIFLGLLGTFFGLATTVPAVVETIGSLAPTDGETSAEVFGRLMTGLEKQMGGMGTAFGSSLLGLAGSLVVGLLDLFAGNAQNRFYREQEEWLSTITRVGFSSGDGDMEDEREGNLALGGGDYIFQHLTDSMDGLQNLFIQSDESRSQTDDKIVALTEAVLKMTTSLGQAKKDQSGGEIVALTDAVMRMTEKMDEPKQDQNSRDQGLLADQLSSLQKIANSQQKMSNGQTKFIESQAQIVELLGKQFKDGSTDAESRMRLRSIDVQLLRILEEMSAGRQDTVAELRSDITALNKSIRTLSRKPPQQPDQRRGKT